LSDFPVASPNVVALSSLIGNTPLLIQLYDCTGEWVAIEIFTTKNRYKTNIDLVYNDYFSFRAVRSRKPAAVNNELHNKWGALWLMNKQSGIICICMFVGKQCMSVYGGSKCRRLVSHRIWIPNCISRVLHIRMITKNECINAHDTRIK